MGKVAYTSNKRLLDKRLQDTYVTGGLGHPLLIRPTPSTGPYDCLVPVEMYFSLQLVPELVVLRSS